VGRNQEDVVECECFLDDAHSETLAAKRDYTDRDFHGQPSEAAVRCHGDPALTLQSFLDKVA
jgi:hypothetical protein